MILEFSLISNVETTFFKKVFNSSAIFLSSCSTSSFSTRFILLPEIPLFQKKWFGGLPKQLTIIDKRGIQFVKEFFTFLFVKPAAIIILFFRSSQRLVRFFLKQRSVSSTLFEIYIFQVGPSHYGFSHNLTHKKNDQPQGPSFLMMRVSLRIQYNPYNCFLKNANFSFKTTNN